jgi:hypothetical protein
MKINRNHLSRSGKYQLAGVGDVFRKDGSENKLFSKEIHNTTHVAEIGSVNLETFITTNDYIQEKVVFK